MKEYNSSDLLALVSIDPDDPECRKAFEEVHRRYKKYIWNLSYKSACSIDFNNPYHVAMVISQNTYMKIYEKAGYFEQRSDDCEKDCRLWISGIVKNITRQYLYENNKHKNHLVFMEILPDIECQLNDTNDIIPLSVEKKVFDKALKTLSDKERSVLLSWYNFYTDGKVQNIDKEIKESLAKQFNVKVDSLKKIKQRAYKKLMTEIEKHI